jgi:hypothetical protein
LVVVRGWSPLLNCLWQAITRSGRRAPCRLPMPAGGDRRAKSVTSPERALTREPASPTLRGDAGGDIMADNLALKLLVAGIIGAVVGAAAAERYHFPTGLVYGGFNSRPPTATYRTRPAIDPMIGSGRAERDRDDDDGAVVVEREPYPTYAPPPRYRGPPPPPRRPAPPPRTAWCWKESENWDFRTTGHYVRCPAGSARRSARDG